MPSDSSFSVNIGFVGWEWIAPTGGVLLGLAGIGTAFATGARQQDTALLVAREERHQSRLEASYTDLLQQMARTSEWVSSVYPVMTATATDISVPPPLPRPETAQAGALSAYWSNEVSELVDTWKRAVQQVHFDAAFISIGRPTEEHPGAQELPVNEFRRDLVSHKEAVRRAEDAVRDRVSEELQGRTADERRSAQRQRKHHAGGRHRVSA